MLKHEKEVTSPMAATEQEIATLSLQEELVMGSMQQDASQKELARLAGLLRETQRAYLVLEEAMEEVV